MFQTINFFPLSEDFRTCDVLKTRVFPFQVSECFKDKTCFPHFRTLCRTRTNGQRSWRWRTAWSCREELTPAGPASTRSRPLLTWPSIASYTSRHNCQQVGFVLIDRFVNDVAAVFVVIAEGRDEIDVSFA